MIIVIDNIIGMSIYLSITHGLLFPENLEVG